MGRQDGSCTRLQERLLPRQFEVLMPQTHEHVGIVQFTAALIFLFMSLITVGFIKSQEFRALEGNVTATQSVIFPVFVKVLWVNALVSLISALIIIYAPLRNLETNPLSVCFLEAIMWALQHMVIEGIAFLLLQKGCGAYAANRALRFTLSWGAVTFFVTFFVWLFSNHGNINEEISNIVFIIWNIVLMIFYFVLWKAPLLRLYRRPALFVYARTWFLYRFSAFIGNMFTISGANQVDAANCGSCIYIILTLFINPILLPVISYVALLQDSRWWQGEDVFESGRTKSYDAMRSPLLGTDFTVASAQVLAEKMDQIRSQKVKILNFARIKLDVHDYLGAGSFSKVYKGYYRGQQCAIKLIYTFDLTEDVIARIAAEASILSSIRHPNVVSIVGVSILPPSVCLLLELCSFGSLSDIIRGYGFDWNSSSKIPMTLSYTDKLYLALGCARGLAAVHNYDRKLCHRDVKSFNFLVDSQFNAKIADLELGIENFPGLEKETTKEDQAKVDEMLANWMAPEVVRNRVYEQASDVYSLGLVFWEIISGQLPFDNHLQPAVRQKLLAGFRHAIPSNYTNNSFSGLIKRAWSEDAAERPSANEIVAELEIMIQEVCYSFISDTDCTPDLTQATDYYELIKAQKSQLDGFNSSIYLRSFLINRDDSMELSSNENVRLSLPEVSVANVGQFLRQSLSKDKAKQSVEDEAASGKKVAMSLQMPSKVNSTLKAIHNYDGWKPLESSQLPWALFSASPPHVLVYTTEAWRFLFGVDEAFHTNTVVSIHDLFRNMSDYEENEGPNNTSSSSNFCSWFSKNVAKKWLFSPSDPKEEMQTSFSDVKGHAVNENSNYYGNNKNINGSSNNNANINNLKTASTDLPKSNNSRSSGTFFSTTSQHGFVFTNSNKINKSYIDAGNKFLSRVNDTYEAHGIVPITRQLGRSIDSILCSLHCYPIYPKRPFESVPPASSFISKFSNNNNNSTVSNTDNVTDNNDSLSTIHINNTYISNDQSSVADDYDENEMKDDVKELYRGSNTSITSARSRQDKTTFSKDVQISTIVPTFQFDSGPVTTFTPAYLAILFNELTDQIPASANANTANDRKGAGHFNSKARSVISLNEVGERSSGGSKRSVTKSTDIRVSQSSDTMQSYDKPVGRFWSAGSSSSVASAANRSSQTSSGSEHTSSGNAEPLTPKERTSDSAINYIAPSLPNNNL